MDVKKRHGSQKIVGISTRTTNENSQAKKDIGACYERFYGEDLPSRIQNKTSQDIYVIYTEYEGNYTQPYTCIIGCPVESFEGVPEGFVTLEIPEKEYAYFEAAGDMPRSIVETWQKIWNSPIEREYTLDFELHGERTYDTPPVVEIYISVKR